MLGQFFLEVTIASRSWDSDGDPACSFSVRYMRQASRRARLRRRRGRGFDLIGEQLGMPDEPTTTDCEDSSD